MNNMIKPFKEILILYATELRVQNTPYNIYLPEVSTSRFGLDHTRLDPSCCGESRKICVNQGKLHGKTPAGGDCWRTRAESCDKLSSRLLCSVFSDFIGSLSLRSQRENAIYAV